MVYESGISILKGKETDPKVFEMEMWVQAISCFFELEHLPMSSYEKSHASLHNYRPEIACVRSGLDKLENTLRHFLGDDQVRFSQFMNYLGSLRQGKRESRTSMEGNFSEAMEHVRDFVRISGDLSTVNYLSLQSYIAFGRLMGTMFDSREIFSDLRKGMALPRLSEVSKESLQPLLKEMKNHKYGAAFLYILMIHFKILKVLQHIEGILGVKKDYPSAVLLFALIHHTWKDMEATINHQILPAIKEENLCDQVESLLFSSRMELRKVMELELVDVNLLLDPKIVHGKIEDSQGICRDLFQQNIITIIAALTEKSLIGEDIFPYYQNRREQSVKLLEALLDLQEGANRFTEEGSRPAFRRLMESLISFHHEYMKYLMYKDWGTVDRFYYDLKGSESLKQKEFLAHQLQVFLQTLIGEVQKRSVLH